MDEHGYPEEDDFAWLRAELSAMDFYRGANAIKQLIEATGYGTASLLEASGANPGRLEVTTGGWSGCEDILFLTHATVWRSAFWDSSHRGGLEVFVNRSGAGGVK